MRSPQYILLHPDAPSLDGVTQFYKAVSPKPPGDKPGGRASVVTARDVQAEKMRLLLKPKPNPNPNPNNPNPNPN